MPGIGPAGAAKLKAAGILTTDDLVAHFFLAQRSVITFSAFLQDHGLQRRWADECAANLKKKLGSV